MVGSGSFIKSGEEHVKWQGLSNKDHSCPKLVHFDFDEPLSPPYTSMYGINRIHTFSDRTRCVPIQDAVFTRQNIMWIAPSGLM